ncbi:hypothetical protein Tco_1561846 [Tanacetum coccineum]
MSNDPLSQEIGSGDRPRRQEAMGGVIAQTRSERASKHSYDSPLPGVNTHGSDEERLEQHELTNNVPPTPHDSPLPGGHTPGSDEGRLQQEKLTDIVTALVKSLEDELKFQKSKSKRRRLTIVTSKDEEDLVVEDPSKQGRSLIEEMDLDGGISLVSLHVEVQGSPFAKGTYGRSEKLKDREWHQSNQAAQGFTDAEWDDVLARVLAADKDFVQQKFFAQQRAEAKRNKPMTHSQQKDYMSNYIKNQEGGYPIKKLKSFSFEQVKDIFETTMRRVQSFVPMGSELDVQRLKRAGQEVLEKPVKRQKIREASGSGEEQSAEKEKELSEEELQKLLVIVLVEELVIQPLQVRDDLVKLWDLVKERFSTTQPTDDKEKELWIELKRLFEPDNDDILWNLKRSSIKQTDQDSKVFGSILNTEGLIQKLDDLKVNHKFKGGLLRIRGFYNLILLVQVCAAAED